MDTNDRHVIEIEVTGARDAEAYLQRLNAAREEFQAATTAYTRALTQRGDAVLDKSKAVLKKLEEKE